MHHRWLNIVIAVGIILQNILIICADLQQTPNFIASLVEDYNSFILADMEITLGELNVFLILKWIILVIFQSVLQNFLKGSQEKRFDRRVGHIPRLFFGPCGLYSKRLLNL